MRYLGFELSDDCRNKKHISDRKKLAFIAISKIKTLGLATSHIGPMLKGHIYRTYVQPILLYGAENCDFTNAEILQRLEGNLVKQLIGVSNRCRTGNLLVALNIPSTKMSIENKKLKFFEQLLLNDFTLSVIRELVSLTSTSSFISEIKTI